MFKKAKVSPYVAGKMKKRRLTTPVRNALISGGVLLVLLVVGGVVYTWLVGRNADENAVAGVATDIAPTLDPIITPSKPAPDAVVSAAVHVLTSPVKPGANSTMSVKTNAEATCTIAVVYGKEPSKDSGLMPKVADQYGMVSWSWTVSETAPAGKWPVKVNCANIGKSAFVQGEQVVKP